MQTITTTVYEYNELSDEAKQTALEKQYNINIDGYNWWDSDFCDFKEIAALIGITVKDIYFSGFCSQGDGACFTGNYEYKKGALKSVKEYAPLDAELHEIALNLQNLQRKYFYQLSANVEHHGHYYHELCTRIQVYKDGDYVNDEAENGITEFLRNFMQWIYLQLNKQYDYLTLEEAIVETLNEYQFTEDGEMI